MKVDPTTSSNLPSLKDALSRSQQSGEATPATSATQGATGTAAPAAGSASGDTSVSLSGLSQHLRSLAASGSADIDTAHVESIKQAIKDGTLQIDSGKIADGVLQTARDLLRNKTSSTGH
ncbi:negative regulator of flagellin synthesis FlgM [Paraburkholderia youngii]|uniref:Negative regulator of flagellin synthesis n=1 Tax=Paraburkholderia youngii TaxID=2782701 RepID=A0A7W8L7I3_9BURK|nr:flagellar biosynthesis anti-sigma factor FlgM [Paraburkholderia youngii]MBB5400616.1 negative regulator of flagellin synthesis FlgM [Paraburkholderia youngii]NVI06260.1 flagellar biosynthesis anti-sigma factor FlgM [Paraburkholderia youngii]